MEIELKYLASKEEAMKILPEEYRIIPMNAVYFDTAAHSLRDRKITVRCRREGEKHVATAKWGGGSSSGMHRRGEYNIEVEDGWTEKPDMTVFWDCEIYDNMVSALGGEYSDSLGNLVPREKVKPVLTMKFIRCEADILLGDGGEAVLSYDEGRIITKNGSEIISEIEVELKNGSEDELRKYGEELEKKYGLVPCDSSKYSRGLALLRKMH